jgi:hypothetical protein
MLSEYSLRTNSLIYTGDAERYAPSDPESHYDRAMVLGEIGDFAGAAMEFEEAAALRPSDYYLWLMLGEARDRANMQEGAIDAYRQSVTLAPHYAEPRWQLGNLLLRQGRADEAFGELRRAAASDPRLLPSLIDLAWGSSNGDAATIVRFVQPETDRQHVALAGFLSRHGKPAEAVSQFRAAATTRDDRKGFVNDLLNAGQLNDAYDLWSVDNAREGERATTVIHDGGFETDDVFKRGAFGWQLSRESQTVTVARDAGNPREGCCSLRVDWNGASNPSTPVISQAVIVEPRVRYNLHFSARTQDIVTGGPPFILITDPGINGRPPAAQSASLVDATGEWRDYDLGFAPGGSTHAVVISLVRQACAGAPCPIFGHLWLDGFSISQRN